MRIAARPAVAAASGALVLLAESVLAATARAGSRSPARPLRSSSRTCSPRSLLSLSRTRETWSYTCPGSASANASTKRRPCPCSSPTRTRPGRPTHSSRARRRLLLGLDRTAEETSAAGSDETGLRAREGRRRASASARGGGRRDEEERERADAPSVRTRPGARSSTPYRCAGGYHHRAVDEGKETRVSEVPSSRNRLARERERDAPGGRPGSWQHRESWGSCSSWPWRRGRHDQP